jgi:hypothetical protein
MKINGGEDERQMYKSGQQMGDIEQFPTFELIC